MSEAHPHDELRAWYKPRDANGARVDSERRRDGEPPNRRDAPTRQMLLAAWLAHRQRPAALARTWLEAFAQGSLLGLVRAQGDLATHRHEAQRIDHALSLLGIASVPVWQLAAHWQSLPEPPALLHVRGNVALLACKRSIAIVGARRASPQGEQYAASLAAEQARRGLLIVSGGAHGIDSAAHRGALSAGGATMAIVGSPIDRLYPASNAALYRAIVAAEGAIVSEHPPLTSTFKSSHARRNRLIAGSTLGLVVAEAAAKSGTMSAAAYARRAATKVWVAPPEVEGERAGIEALLKEGLAETLQRGQWAF